MPEPSKVTAAGDKNVTTVVPDGPDKKAPGPNDKPELMKGHDNQVAMTQTPTGDLKPLPANPPKGGLIPDGKGGRRWVSQDEVQAYNKAKAERQAQQAKEAQTRQQLVQHS